MGVSNANDEAFGWTIVVGNDGRIADETWTATGKLKRRMKFRHVDLSEVKATEVFRLAQELIAWSRETDDVTGMMRQVVAVITPQRAFDTDESIALVARESRLASLLVKSVEGIRHFNGIAAATPVHA